MSAIKKNDYRLLYQNITDNLESKRMIKRNSLKTVEEKMHYIDTLLEDVLTTEKFAENAFTKFDKKALSPVVGKLMAFGIILVRMISIML